VPEFFGQTHQSNRLPIPFGFRHPEIPEPSLLRVTPLLLPDDDYGPGLESPHPTDHRGVVAVPAVTPELQKIREKSLDKIQRVRAFGMPRELHFFVSIAGLLIFGALDHLTHIRHPFRLIRRSI
jgi:hypothetical protein